MDERIKAIRQIMICVNRIDGIFYQWARHSGAKENTLSLFYALSDGQPHSQKEICDEWLIPRTTINTIVKECIQEGLVTFDTNTHGKEKLLLLTESGKKLAEEKLQGLCSSEQKAFDATVQQYGNILAESLSYFTDQLEMNFLKPEKGD